MQEVKELELSQPQEDVRTASTPYIFNIAGQGTGKTFLIASITAPFIINFPKLKGFIGANTEMQLAQSTLARVLEEWKNIFGMDEYSKENPSGCYVINKTPPSHFKKLHKVPKYNKTISFENGCLVFIGSLENYKAHDGKEFGWAHLDETKDTKEEALSDVIEGRLRQKGLFVNDETGDVVFNERMTDVEQKEQGLRSWNPLYIHTSPSGSNIDWLLKKAGLWGKETELKRILDDENNYYIDRSEFYTTLVYQTYWNAQNLPSDYIPTRKAVMSELKFLKFIKGYPFSKGGGEAYPSFDRTKAIAKYEIFNPSTYHVGFDFNVLPYVTGLRCHMDTRELYRNINTGVYYETPGQWRKKVRTTTFYFSKCYAMRPPQNTTKLACKAIENDMQAEHEDAKNQVNAFVYGDASGNNRIEGLGSLTQYKIIQKYLKPYLFGSWKRVGKTNMNIAKRVEFLDDIFGGRKEGLRIIIDPSCEELISDFEFVKKDAEGKKIKEREKGEDGISYEKIGHFSDVAEYIVTYYCKEILNLKIF